MATKETHHVICQSKLTKHHSDDIFKVFHGHAEPDLICGYHVSMANHPARKRLTVADH